MTEAERRKVEHTDDTAMNACRKLLPKSEDLYQVQSATDAAGQVLRDSVGTFVRVKRVTKVPNVPHALRPATTTDTKASPKNFDMKAVTDGDTTVPMR